MIIDRLEVQVNEYSPDPTATEGPPAAGPGRTLGLESLPHRHRGGREPSGDRQDSEPWQDSDLPSAGGETVRMAGNLALFDDIEYKHPISVYDDIGIMPVNLRYRSSDVVLRYRVR